MGQKARDGYCLTCLFTKDHGDLPFTCQIAFSDLYKSIVRFAFSKRSRVHTINILSLSIRMIVMITVS